MCVCGRLLLINYRARIHTRAFSALSHTTPRFYENLLPCLGGIVRTAGSHQPTKDTIHLKQLSLNYVLKRLNWLTRDARELLCGENRAQTGEIIYPGGEKWLIILAVFHIHGLRASTIDG